MIDSLRIVTWNANGLKGRLGELEIFLNDQQVDIALISETHLTTRDCLRLRGYSTYHTPHPDGGAHGGSAIIIKQNVQHFQEAENVEERASDSCSSFTGERNTECSCCLFPT